MTSLSPEQARQRLDEAAERARLSQTNAVIGAAFTGVVAVLVAATLAAVTLWRENPVGIVISMTIYGAALVLLLWWQKSEFRISDRRWSRRYLLGFGLTMVLYSAGILWESLAFPGWIIFAPYCVLVAVPGLVAAVRMLRP